MPLERQIIDVPIAAGQNEKWDARVLPGGAASVTNGRIQRKGLLSKRFGHTALSKGSIVAAIAGGSWRGAPWLADGSFLWTWSDQAAQWTQIARTPEVAIYDRIPVTGFAGATASGNISIFESDVASGNNYVVTVWTTDLANLGYQQLYYQVQDATSGATVVVATEVFVPSTNVHAPKLIVCGTTLVLTYVHNGSLFARSQSLTTLAGWSGPATLVATLVGSGGAGIYDAVPVVGDATRFAIAHEIAAGGNSMRVATYNVSGLGLNTSTQNETLASFSTFEQIALRSQSGDLHWVAYTATAGSGITGTAFRTRAYGVLDSGMTNLTPVTIYTWPTSGVYSSGTGNMAIERCGFGSQNAVVFWSPFPTANHPIDGAAIQAQQIKNNSGATAVVGSLNTIFGVMLASRPKYLGSTTVGQCYAFAYNGSALQGSYYLLCFDWFGSGGAGSTRVVAQPSPRLAQSIPPGGLSSAAYVTLANMAPFPSAAGTTYCFPMLISTAVNYNTIQLAVADFAAPNRYQTAELPADNLVAMTCGSPSVFDGNDVFELGYTYYPELAPSAQSAGGSLTMLGTYGYQVTYEWYDAAGNWHVSAPSPIQTTVLVSTNGTITLTIPTLVLTQRSFVNAVIYRTVTTGTIFYRIGQVRCPTGAASVTYADTASDAAVQVNALLYTTGGVFANMQPPTARVAITHKGRWWLAGADDPKFIWPSQPIVDGVCPGFNEALNFLCSGPVRALASLDDKLIIFVQRGLQNYGIEYITGDGPTATGSASDWPSFPFPVPSPTGAIDQRSICVGPFGVLFASPNGGTNGKGGIFLLTRDLQVQYAGEPVETTFQAFPVVTSAVLHPHSQRVYFTCVDSDTSPVNGVRIVWDFGENAWHIDKLGDPDNSTTQQGARHEWIANANGSPTVHWCNPQGRVYREVNTSTPSTANANTDGGQFVSMGWTSPFIRANGTTLSGYFRAWRVRFKGESTDPANFTVILRADDQSYAETTTWTAAQIAAFDRYTQVEVAVTPGNGKVMNLQLQVSDAAPTGGPTVTTGAGMSWIAASIEMGVDTRGFPNVTAGQRA